MSKHVEDLIGLPFIDGGRNPTVGLDCWGLSTEVFRRYGIILPDYKISCEDASRIHSEVNEQRSWWRRCEGDIPVPALVVIRFTVYCDHTGVYIGQGRFIHTRKRIGVNIDRIDNPAWANRIEGFYVPEVKK
ncbi:C40 family peptidase [Sporomusa sphaeroides]|uniref:C40 family peptidase n=1 Tax=Sporomusa sphaeroides TaxID=47679 RepID=UPI002B7D2327|nr:NlpC/P60 family protein [Sporomusa sphaeroides]HML32910.1 NlpC/P60 family protein [Sporomusa sphaeroides]